MSKDTIALASVIALSIGAAAAIGYLVYATWKHSRNRDRDNYS